MPVEVPTFDALYTVVQSEIQTRNPALTDFNQGSALDSLTGAGAIAADESIRIGIKTFATKFLDTATGADLDALVADRYPDMGERTAETYAVVPLIFTRGDAIGVLEIPAGTACRASVNGQTLTFETNAAAYIAVGDDEVEAIATCTTAGRSGNVAEDTITTIVDAIPGDATATVTNAERAVGGAAEETDDDLRARARRYHGTLRKATVGALEVAALTVPGVRFATVDESRMAPEDGGYVSVYVGDPDARANSALAALVDAALDDVRAAGVDVRVTSAEREEVDIEVNVVVRRGSDRTGIVTAVRAAIVAYVGSLAAGDTLYLSQLDAAVCSVSSDVLGCSIAAPTVDKEPSDNYKAIRVLDADLSVTVTEV